MSEQNFTPDQTNQPEQAATLKDTHGYGSQYIEVLRTSRLAIASLVLGLIFFIAWPLPGLAAVITGHIALHRIKKTGQPGRGFAITGVILGYFFFAAFIALIAIVYVLAANGDLTTQDLQNVTNTGGLGT